MLCSVRRAWCGLGLEPRYSFEHQGRANQSQCSVQFAGHGVVWGLSLDIALNMTRTWCDLGLEPGYSFGLNRGKSISGVL
jgi:hypothetical protein